MSTFFVFFGILLVSLVVSFIALLQLVDFFQTPDELLLVTIVLVALNIFSMLILGAAYAVARRVFWIAVAAVLLCIVAAAPMALRSVVDLPAGGLGIPDPLRGQNLAVSLELTVPAVIAILVQWGLVRHRWLRVRGQEDLSRWPWVTTVIAGLVILNPLALNVIAAALQQSAADWFRQMWAGIAAGGVVVLTAMALIEYYIRGRMLGRRLGAA